MAVVLASVDSGLVTGPQVLRPGTVYTLRLDVRLGSWPKWADRLDAELTSHLNESEVQTPSFTWQGPGSVTTADEPLVGEGTLLLRFGLPAGLELTRFRGHPMVGAERKVHDAEEPSGVLARVPTADR